MQKWIYFRLDGDFGAGNGESNALIATGSKVSTAAASLYWPSGNHLSFEQPENTNLHSEQARFIPRNLPTRLPEDPEFLYTRVFGRVPPV